MSTIGKVKIEPKVQIKLDCNNDEMLIESSFEVKAEPGFETKTNIKTEKIEDCDEGKSIPKWKIFVTSNRWLRTLPFGSVIKDSPIVPFKMPFVGTDLQPCPPECRFDIFQLLTAFPNVGLIVDLTNKLRTYPVSDLVAFGVEYVNIPVKLFRKNKVPKNEQLKLFIDTCSRYSTKNCGKLIAVHDLLGNRESAYMICKALANLGFSVKEAMERFEIARGYSILQSMVSVLAGRVKKWTPQIEVKRLIHKQKQKKAKKQRKDARKAARQVKVEPKWEH